MLRNFDKGKLKNKKLSKRNSKNSISIQLNKNISTKFLAFCHTMANGLEKRKLSKFWGRWNLNWQTRKSNSWSGSSTKISTRKYQKNNSSPCTKSAWWTHQQQNLRNCSIWLSFWCIANLRNTQWQFRTPWSWNMWGHSNKQTKQNRMLKIFSKILSELSLEMTMKTKVMEWRRKSHSNNT